MHAPEKEITIIPKNIIRTPWVTSGLLKSNKTLDRLYIKQKNKHPEHPSKTKYKLYKRNYDKVKNKARLNITINYYMK